MTLQDSDRLPQTACLRLGSRGSTLALAQSELVRAALLAAAPNCEVVLERITTRGDLVLDRPLYQLGDKALFVEEIEQALRSGQIDLAVHSAKDLPSELPSDMALAAFPARADARDVLVAGSGRKLAELPAGARVGTSSLRRACQLRHLRPDLDLADIRGNVDTRLRKLHEGQYAAIVLAAAGLARLGLLGQVTEYLEPSAMVPAVTQGVLAIEIRATDSATAALLEPLDDAATRTAVRAERAFVARIGAGCQAPVGAHARLDGERLTLTAMIGARDGRLVHGEQTGSAEEPEALGMALADSLLADGGAELLTEQCAPSNEQ